MSLSWFTPVRPAKRCRRFWVIRLGLVERDLWEEYVREPGGKRNFIRCLEGLLIRWMIHSSGLPGEAHSSRSGPAGHALYHRRKRKQREIGLVKLRDSRFKFDKLNLYLPIAVSLPVLTAHRPRSIPSILDASHLIP